MKRTWRAIRAALRALAFATPQLLIDIAGIVGVGSISYGAWLIYEPAGFITGGLIFAAGAIRLGSLSGRGR